MCLYCLQKNDTNVLAKYFYDATAHSAPSKQLQRLIINSE